MHRFLRTFRSVLLSSLVIAGVLAVPVSQAHAAATSPSLVWTRNTPGIIRESSPLVTDLDGQKDVVVGARDGNVYAFHGGDGGDVGGWPRQLGNPIDSSPAAADVDANGTQDVFVGSGVASARGGDLWRLDANGAVNWKFHPSDNDFPSLSVFSSPSIGDVDANGTPDVSAFALGLLGWSLDASGKVNGGWPFYQDDTVFSSPALFDVDRDGKTDYVVGADSTAGPPVDHQGGFVRAIRGDGSLIWAFPTNEIVRSSPVVGDIDGDGEPEIVVGTGDYWVRKGAASDSTKLLVLDRQGNLKWSRDLGAYTVASPALADVDGNGTLDIIESTWEGSDPGRVFVYDGAGNTLPGWGGRASGGGVVLGQVSTADFDADGAQDVVVNTGGGVYVYSGKSANLLFGLRQGASAYQNSPWIGDIDDNGKLDIVIAGALPGDTQGIVQRWEMPNTTAKLGALGWSQFRKDNRHTGSWVATPLARNVCDDGPREGYWMAASDGGIFAFCGASFQGSMGGKTLNAPIVDLARTNSRNGYWEVASDGGIFGFGDAQFYGSAGSLKLVSPIVGMTPTVTGKGYWLVAADGGVFAYGDAQFHGSMGGKPLNSPIVGITATADGYRLVAADGGIFAFGDAKFHGSMGGQPLNRPIVGIESTASGNGYWEVASDGGIFAFGDARFFGSTGSIKLNQPIVGISRRSTGDGYRLVAGDGGIFAFNAPFLGSMGGHPLNRPVVAMAS